MEVLVRIKRCALAGRLRLTNKARDELEINDLDIADIRESLLNATTIYKTIRSFGPSNQKREYLHIIRSPNWAGVVIYTKGKLATVSNMDTY
jgi:hypothetical protein